MPIKHVDSDLECYYCFLTFPSFKELANHVTDAHTSATAKRERERREAWNLFDKEMEDMLPAPGGSRDDARQGRGRGQLAAVPFLTVDFLTAEKQEATILDVETKPTKFNDLTLKIKIDDKRFFLGLKTSNPNYEELFNALGGDEKKWKGRRFMVGLNWNEFHEKSFVHVFEVLPAEKGDKKK